MKILGLIPARGGSKGIPRKNVATLGDRPLIAWTCAAGVASTRLDRLVASTDDPEIAAVARAHGAEAPFLRPPELARDDSPSVDAARHAVDWLATEQGWRADVVVLLQPTSPFRTGVNIDEAVALLESTGADTVVSVVPVPHTYSPYSLMQCDEHGWLKDFWNAPLPFDRFRRQEHPVLVARNGPAVLVARAEVLAAGRFYGDRIAPYAMDLDASLDIDGPEDLARAELMVRWKGISPCAR